MLLHAHLLLRLAVIGVLAMNLRWRVTLSDPRIVLACLSLVCIHALQVRPDRICVESLRGQLVSYPCVELA